MIVKPSAAQYAYHQEELAAFIHFGINTYTEVEWGDQGPYDLKLFNPTNLDTDQWVKVLKDCGFKRVIITVKHHDGFVLYPSKYTDYNISASSYDKDLLEELSKSVTKYDIGMGLYLSPWDAHDERYAVQTQKEYNDYYVNQLEEILGNPKYGNNGKFVEVWMDGAHGYGENYVEYDFKRWFDTIHRLQGDINIFSTRPTSVRWIGNEAGMAGDPLWQKVTKSTVETGNYPVDINQYLNHGDIHGDLYSVGECDVSIRSGWFYGDGSGLKPVSQLLDIYFNSVGKGAPLLLNIPPNKEGKFSEDYVARLYEFSDVMNKIHDYGLMKHKLDTNFPPSILAPDNDKSLDIALNQSLEITFDKEIECDVFNVQEDIRYGQSIKEFVLEAFVNNKWKIVAQGNTVGYRRLLRFPKVQTNKIRFTVLDALEHVKIRQLSLHKIPEAYQQSEAIPQGMTYVSHEVFIKEKDHMWIDIVASDFYVITQQKCNEIVIDGEDLITPTDNLQRSPHLNFGKHHISANKEIAGLLINSDNSYSYVEFEQKELCLERARKTQLTIERFGNLELESVVKLVSKPGSAVHGRHYKDIAMTVKFSKGENKKQFIVETLKPSEAGKLYFDLELESAQKKTIIGINKNIRCEIKAANA